MVRRFTVGLAGMVAAATLAFTAPAPAAESLEVPIPGLGRFHLEMDNGHVTKLVFIPAQANAPTVVVRGAGPAEVDHEVTPTVEPGDDQHEAEPAENEQAEPPENEPAEEEHEAAEAEDHEHEPEVRPTPTPSATPTPTPSATPTPTPSPSMSPTGDDHRGPGGGDDHSGPGGGGDHEGHR